MAALDKKYTYFVLYIRDTEQYKLMNIIGKNLPAGHGEAFIPRMELYRRGEKKVKETPIFPGYVFIHTDFSRKKIHGILKNCHAVLDTAFRELALKELQMSSVNSLYGEEGDFRELSDLDEEEAGFLDLLRQGGGLLAMSCGYEENQKYHVMEGPLKAYEDKIQKVDKHNRKAFLRLEVNGRQARAGFECKPKTHWYPKEGVQIATLPDGTKVDLGKLKKRVMTI